MFRRSRWLWAPALLLLAGCSREQPRARDAGAPDAQSGPRIGDHCEPEQGWLPDVGAAAGAPNASGEDALPPIGAGTCGLWPDAPAGYFTARCERDVDCPDGARCGRGSYWCVARCRSNADCIPPASCHLSAAAVVSYCQVTGGVLARGDRDAGASDDCELPCGFYQTCCRARCFDLANDPEHCGHCSHSCEQHEPYCQDGHCVETPCATSCENGSCCGGSCCASGETCCAIYGPEGAVATCIALAAEQSCPSGCHDC